MTKTEMEKPTGGAPAILSDRQQAFDLLMGAIRGEVNLIESYDSTEVQRALALGILADESDEAFVGQAGLAPWSEWLGQPVELREVHFNPSRIEGGPGFYAVCSLVNLQTGEAGQRHIGGFRPVAELVRVWARGMLPVKCKVVEVAQAMPGQNAPLGIVKLDEDDA